MVETMSGIPLDPSYGDGLQPGEYPYTRGLHPTGYRSKLWTMRMFAGFGTATDTNARFHALLRAGGTGLSTAFDMPTLMGRDSDHEWSVGEVGRAGWPSTLWPTWRTCSRASNWTRSPPR